MTAAGPQADAARARDLPVGHPLRRPVARALVLMAFAAVVFTGFAFLTTQVHAVRSGSPWQDDPYHTVVSFTELFVPGLAVLAALRALLWRTGEPQPVARVDQLLRAAKAIGVLVGLTGVTDLIALVLRADHRLWNRLTPVSVAGLILVAATLVGAVGTVWPAHRAVRRTFGAHADRGDWLGDLLLLTARLTAGLPSRPRLSVRLVTDRVARWSSLPRHLPCVSGAAVLLIAGALFSAVQALQERYPVTLFVFDLLVTAGSTYAGLALINGYLHLVAVSLPATRVGRAARLAFVLGCLALLVAVGFRDLIWAGMGLGQVHTVSALFLVTFGGGALVAVVVFCGLLSVSAGRPSRGWAGSCVATRRSDR